MNKMNIDLKISGLEPMKKIISLLTDNYSTLPSPIQEAISELYADERTCWDIEYFHSIGLCAHQINVFADGEELKKVVAIYPDESEALIAGKGIRKVTELQVINATTGEPVCGISNGDKE